MDMEETRKPQARLRRRASGIYIPEPTIPSTLTAAATITKHNRGLVPKSSTPTPQNNTDNNNYYDSNLYYNNSSSSSGGKSSNMYGANNPHRANAKPFVKPVTFTTTSDGIVNVRPVNVNNVKNTNSNSNSARSPRFPNVNNIPEQTSLTISNSSRTSHILTSPRKSTLTATAAAAHHNKNVMIKNKNKNKMLSHTNPKVDIEFVAEAKPKPKLLSRHSHREKDKIKGNMFESSDFFIENEFDWTNQSRTRTKKENTKILMNEASESLLGNGDGDGIELQKSASRCTVDGLGFDLETIDLTNDEDRNLLLDGTDETKSTKSGRTIKQKDSNSPNQPWYSQPQSSQLDGENFENSLSKKVSDGFGSSSVSLSSANGTETESDNSPSDNNNNENDHKKVKNTSKNKNKPASRYISVESLVLEDNFNASAATAANKKGADHRNRHGKTRSKSKSPKHGQKSEIFSDDNFHSEEESEEKANLVSDLKGNNNYGKSGTDSEEIPQVKVVWTTPPQQISPRAAKDQGQSDVVETPVSNPNPTLNSQNKSILDFFTRTEDGVEKEGRYDDVEHIIRKFFTKTDDDDSNAVNKCINLKQVMDNMDEFVLQPAAIGYDIQCRVTRDRKGVDRGLYPTYYMHLERPDGRKVLLLTGRKRKKSTTSNYLISTDAADLSRDSSHFAGKVRSNLLGTQFTIYDNGQSYKRLGLFQTYGSSAPAIREELAAVIYEPNVLGFKGPRKMKILIPEMKNEAKRREHRPEREKDNILDLVKQAGPQEFFELRNKAPIWNDDNQSFVLNFHGRVTQASVKNFQIIHENKEDYVMLQFGRVAADLFTMDYRYPLCALQAFAIVLTSFDNKLACE